MSNLTQLRAFLLRASRLIREGDPMSAEQIIQNCLTSLTAMLERSESTEKVLLDISIDVENEILRQCKRANCDDQQTDLINGNTTAIFDLNKQKYLRMLEQVTSSE